MYGIQGNIVRINLTKGTVSIESMPEKFYRQYFGGRCLASYFALREIPSDAEPLSPENKLIFAVGPLTGHPIPGAARYVVAGKSPLSNIYGEATVGGNFGPELKWAGFDAVIIEGKAKKPVYIYIKNGKAEIRDASAVWGRETAESQDIIRQELGDSHIQVACIGPAGEKLVRFACILSGPVMRHAAGRTGLGAVMGSKNIKAIAVRGTKKVTAAFPGKIKTITKEFIRKYKENPDVLNIHTLGTLHNYASLNSTGILPTRNFREGVFEGCSETDGYAFHRELIAGKHGCYACPIKCKRLIELNEKYQISAAYGAPEYETQAALGSLCSVKDPGAIAKAAELCNRYGLDTISTGTTIAFAMECYEKGIITKNESGIELNWGNGDAVITLIRQIAEKEKLGKLLAEGSARAAEELGEQAKPLAMTIKSVELPMHDPRGKTGLGIGYAVSPRGADHLQIVHDWAFDKGLDTQGIPWPVTAARPLGILEPVDRLSLGPEKIRLYARLQTWRAVVNSLVLCIFTVGPLRVYSIPEVVGLLEGVTGWSTSVWELMKMGERASTLARCFNIKHGWRPEDDRLPDRFYEPLPKGPSANFIIERQLMQEAIRSFYEIMGWERENGRPTKGKLIDLELEWVESYM